MTGANRVRLLLLTSLCLIPAFNSCSLDKEPVVDGMGVSKHLERVARSEDQRIIDKSMQAVAQAGAPAVRYIIETWKDEDDSDIRCRLATIIDMIGPSADAMVPLLIKELDEIDEKRISCAALALGGIGPAAVPAAEKLGSLLRSSDSSTQINILYALSGIGQAAENQIPLIMEAVERDATRNAAIKALSGIGVPAVHAVLPWLESGNVNQRLWACQVLSGTSQENVALVLDPLSKALRDKNPAIRIEAAKALGAARTNAIPVYQSIVYGLRDQDADVREAVAQALILIGPVGGKELINALNDKFWWSREGAARVIGTFSSLAETAKPNLITRLGDPQVEVRLAVINALTVLGPKIVDDMVPQLRSKEVYCRFGAARVLGQIGPPAKEALPELKKLLNDKDTLVRTEAQNAIKKIMGI